MLEVNQIKKLTKFRTLSALPVEKLIKVYELKKGDNVLIWTDNGKTIAPKLAKTIFATLNTLGCNVSFIVDKHQRKISKCSNITSEGILSLSKGDCFISIASGNRGRLSFENKFTMRSLMKKNGFKMVSMGGLASIKPTMVNSFIASFDHDEVEVIELNNKIKSLMGRTSFVHITCPLGTDLTLTLGKREVICNDGNFRAYSTNYPVGETYTAPIENSANGVVFVSSAKISGSTIIPKKPIKFVFENGVIKSINDSQILKNLKYIEKKNKEKKVINFKNAIRTIAEFAIGTNRKAKIVGAMICDEKTLGTVHFAYGNNKHLGGENYCLGHFDNVIVKPTVYFDGKKIMDNGKLLV